ncbi:MAG: hypothetical protein IJU48_05180 [Synergistaceae bacterium]|nr:hypothetical protein [Synergistaceae bacterium]
MRKSILAEMAKFQHGDPVIAVPVDISGDLMKYSLTIYVKTIEDCRPVFINSVSLMIEINADYPEVSPIVKLNGTKLFHPNFTISGFWTDNEVRPGETLSEYILRLAGALEFKQINTSKPGNHNASAWYYNHKNIFTDSVPKIKIKRRNINTHDRLQD